MKRVTTKPVLDKRYDKASGTYPVLLRITYDRKHMHLTIKGQEFTDKNWLKMWSLKPGDLMADRTKINDFQAEAVSIIDDIPHFSFDEFRKRYKNKDERTADYGTLKAQFKKYETSLWSREQVKTAYNYKNAFHSLDTFRPNMRITEITVELLRDYQFWMKKNGKSLTTVSIYLRALRTIINKALDSGEFPNDKKYYPFGKHKFKIPAPLQKKKTLSVDQLAKLIKYRPLTTEKSFARDMFLFSYYCGGPNPVDIAKFRYEWIIGSHIHFPMRSKTENTNPNQEPMPPVFIDSELNAIINKWKVGKASPKGFVFGILNDKLDAKQIVEKVNAFNKAINAGLRDIAKNDLKFDCIPTMGYARATQANNLLQAGVDIEKISKYMGHASPKTTKIYLKQLPVNLEDDTLSKLRLPKLKIV